MDSGRHDTDGADFYRRLPVHRFDAAIHAGNYTPLPDGWTVGAADVVGSTALIERGRYKVVNTIGAAVVCAQVNAVAGGRSADLPFVFGGDGAVFAVPPERAAASEGALAATVHWARAAWGIELRAATLSVEALRALGHDVRVLKVAPGDGEGGDGEGGDGGGGDDGRGDASPICYAMFEGGGVRHLETAMKRGEHAVAPGDPAARPDLAGLSCRWEPVRATHGRIVSLLVVPEPGASDAALDELYGAIDRIARGLERGGHPLPLAGPRWPLVARNLRAEWRAARHGRGLLATTGRIAHVVGENAFAWGLDRWSRTAGRFDPKRYARVLAANADFRKISDGLMMTIDCDARALAALRRTLDRARAAGLVRYGLSEQDEAIVTCIVPSPLEDDHIHFVDGARGGYATAAAGLA